MEHRIINVLLVEDNPGDARLIREMLSESRGVSYRVCWVEQLATTLEHLFSDQHTDIILLDLLLPDSEGLETFSTIHEKTKKIPIVVLTGLDDEELALQALRLGAQDYLVKGILEKDLLQRAIRYAIARNRVEEALRESEAFSSNLLLNAPNPIIVIEADTSVRYVNPAFEKVTGFYSSEVVGARMPYPWWTTESIPQVSKDFERAIQTGARRLEELFQKKNGEHFWVEITSDAISNAGIFQYYIASWLDVTEIKEAEEELKKHRDKLEELVLDRTAKLIRANEKLQQEVDDRRKAEEKVKTREQELEIKSRYLEEANTALKVLLKHREEDKTELQENVLSNVRELIQPYIEKMKNYQLVADQSACLNVIETNLNNIVSPFLRNITLNQFNLTPREIQVANLVKEGKTTKEIAELLNLSTRAVEFHRDNIRNKLGLKNKKSNLRSILLSLQK